MQKFKKTLSLCLCILMVLSMCIYNAPTYAQNKIEPISNATTTSNQILQTQEDILIYNLQNKEIIIGKDKQKAEQDSENYKLFDENGNYTIDLEEDAFFPYEVQFKYNGITQNLFFEDKDSILDINSHKISLSVADSDNNYIQKMGAYINGEYVAFTPEKKHFTNKDENIYTPVSLLDLNTKNLNLDLSKFLPHQLKNVKLSYILSNEAKADDHVYYYKYENYNDKKEDYKKINLDDSIDISEEHKNFSFIVGADSQLAETNKKYELNIRTLNWIRAQLYYTDGDYQDVSIRKVFYQDSNGNIDEDTYSIDVNIDTLKDVKLKLYFNRNIADNLEQYKMYEGEYKTKEEFDESKDITDKIFKPHIVDKNEESDKYYTLYTKTKQGEEHIYKFKLNVLNSGLLLYNLGVDYNTGQYGKFYKGIYRFYHHSKSETDYFSVNTIVFKMKGYSKDEITKVVEGNYTNLSETNALTDIKEQLLKFSYNINIGYKFVPKDKNNLDFSIFTSDNKVHHINIRAYPYTKKLDLKNVLLKKDDKEVSNRFEDRGYEYSEKNYRSIKKYNYYIQSIEYQLSDSYNMKLELKGDYSYDDIDKVCLGYYDKKSDAVNEADIKDKLLSPYDTTGYSIVPSDFKDKYEGIITIFTKDNIRFSFKINFIEPILSSHSYFRIDSFKNKDSSYYDYISYKVNAKDDSYVKHHGYSIFLIKDKQADLTKMIPKFFKDDKVNVYLDEKLQESGVSEVDFSRGYKIYSVTPEDKSRAENHFVNVKKLQDGAKLYVAGEDVKTDEGKIERDVTMNYGDIKDEYHDIFFANIGDSELTGIKAELIDAKNVKIHEYWKANGTDNDKLDKMSVNDQNIGKIRLVPDIDPNGDGKVSGILRITADGQTPVDIVLKGMTGNPKIITKDIPIATKYVHYSVLIQTNNIYKDNNIKFALAEDSPDKLPEGLTFMQNGEIYGVPKEFGEFKIKVIAKHSEKYKQFEDMSREYTLTVLDNSDENVEARTDDGHKILDRISEINDDNIYKQNILRSEGKFSDFVNAYLDGEKLVENTDYTAEEGSTRIVVKSQTFARLENGRHTISAEFRENKSPSSPMKRTAQNFNINIKRRSSDENSGSSGGSGGGGSNSQNSKPQSNTDEDKKSKQNKTQEESDKKSKQNKTQVDTSIDIKSTLKAFTDVQIDKWYAKDIEFVLDNKLMFGVGDKKFAPDKNITAQEIVEVLSRLSEDSMDKYKDMNIDNIESNKWYSTSLKWAKSNNILDNIEITDKALSRRDMIILIHNYLKYKKIKLPQITSDIKFADEKDMSKEEKEIYTVLYKLGIVQGTSTDKITISANTKTTRAQLASIIKRIKNL